MTPVYLPAWQFGGTVRAIHAMTMALTEAGHEVEVVTTTIGTDHRSLGQPTEARIDGVRVTYVPGRVRWGGSMAPSLARELLGRIGPGTVIHVSSGWQPAFRTMFAGLHRLGAPYAYSSHGCFAPEVFSKGRVKKLVYYRAFEQNHLRRAAEVIATSEIEAADLRRRELSLRVVVIPNICDPRQWLPAAGNATAWRRDRSIADDEVLILQVCRPDPIKNTAFLMEVLRGLPKGRRYVLGVMGPGQTGTGADDSIPDHVRVLRIEGASGSDVLRAAYSAAEIVAVPSLYECFGNVVVEAAFCGARILAAPRVGAAHLPELAGAATVMPLDAAAWRQAIVRSPPRAAAPSAWDRGRLAAAIAPAPVAEQLTRLYSSMLRSGGASG